MTDGRRGVLARVGVSLLNLLAPGLGLLRIGEWRRAVILYAVAVSAFLVLIAGFATTQTMSFRVYAFLVGGVLLVCLLVYVLAIWWTWRGTKTISETRPIWSRWYSVLAAMLVAFGVSWILSGISRSKYRNFYLPSEAMEPTLYKSDKLVAAMGTPNDLRRGDIVLVKTREGSIYIKRVAALPGDRISLKQGRVFINGEAANLEPVGRRIVSYPYMAPTVATVLRERFPGEGSSHIIQDLGPSAIDDFAEVVVERDHVFVLGDNRDNSADSRVDEIAGGVEQVPLRDVIGRPLFTYWPVGKMGRSLRGSSLQ